MHLGIIMDGNGRWAVQRRLPRAFDHKRGASRVTEIVKVCPDLNIKTLTLYAFSTENWLRAAHEVASLMKLFRGYLQNKFLELVDNNVKVVFLGDPKPIARDIVLQMKKLENESRENNKFSLNIALNYGGRDEIIRSTKSMAEDLLAKKIGITDINEELFNNYLDTKGQNDPDLIIRTAGEKRLSNFLLWQSTYSELYFSDKMWPEFSVDCLKDALESYNLRTRKFGKLPNSTKKMFAK